MRAAHLPLILYLLFTAILINSNKANAQVYCDSAVPSFIVDLSASPNMNWVSPPIQRDGSCCGSTAPDVCLEFIITLNANAIAINFNIASGAVPPGALYYQINCGPPVAVGSPICLYGPGPHHLTFCKPGNNVNTFSIESYPDPIIGPDITLNAGCQGMLYAEYYDESSISWTSIYPGATGAYNSLLSCTSGCDTTYFTAPVSGPAYIDYLVCGNDIAGCNPNPICDTIRVNLIPPVSVGLSSLDSHLCPGQTTTISSSVTGGTAPYTISWNTGQSSQNITAGPGTYSVNVTDASGCYVATDQITISPYPAPIINAGPDVEACQGSSVTLSANGGISYSWNNGVTNGIPFGQAVGSVTYTVTGTDANGCVATDQVNVLINPLPVVDAGPNQTICDGESVTLNGSGANSYVWDNGVTNGVAFTPSVGTSQYIVTGTDVNGCVNTDVVQVLVNPLPVIDAGPDVEICETMPVTLNCSGAVNYSWNGGIQNGVSFNAPLGSTTYEVIGTDMNGCESIDQVNVVVNPLPNIDAGPDQVICEGEQVVLTALGGASYIWTGGVQTGVSFTPAVGTNIYIVQGTDLNNCLNQDTVLVIVNPNPELNAGPDITICEGTSVTLDAQGSEFLVWDNGIYNNQAFFQDVGVVEYIAYDTLPTGCSASDTVTVTVNPNPVITASDQEICEGESVALTASGADNYYWSNGVSNGSPFYPSQTDEYEVIGMNDTGCSDTISVTVVVNPNPTAAFYWTNSEISTNDPGTGFVNLSSGADYYEWDFGDGSPYNYEFEPYHEFPDAEGDSYYITLTATTEAGCVDVASNVLIVEQSYTIYVPNAFTPDGDTYNQFFYPVMYGFDKYDFEMLIFNRWGEIVFETHNMEVGWDGTYAGGRKCQDGTYTWKIQAKVQNSSKVLSYTGHVNLIK